MIGHLEMLDGRPVRAYGSVQNIQAQKLAQIALENSTGWLKLSMNMAHMHAWRWDKRRCVRVRHRRGSQDASAHDVSRHGGNHGRCIPEGSGP
jgi:hypothetical protein